MRFDYFIDVPEAKAEDKKREILSAFGIPRVAIKPGEKYTRFSLLIEQNLPRIEEVQCSEDSVL